MVLPVDRKVKPALKSSCLKCEVSGQLKAVIILLALPHVINWIFDEDRSAIRTGFGPENMTRLRRFAIGLVKSKKMRKLNKNTRAVLDYLKITSNTTKPCGAVCP